MKLDFEQYFADALTALIRRNGGSIEEALDDMKIKDGPTRGSIKHWYGWDEEDHINIYTVLVYQRGGELVNTFKIGARSRERAEEIVNNIVCELTTNGAFNDIEVYTDDPDGMFLLTTLSQIGAAEFKEDNISFMDGLTFELQEDPSDLPDKEDIRRPSTSLYDEDGLERYIYAYLQNTYGYKPKSFKFDYDEQRVYIYDITWNIEKGGK